MNYERYIAKDKEKIRNHFSGMEEQYRLKKVDFIPDTRVTRVYFEKILYYKTVEKYVQNNYLKTPVYSNWKTKKSEIKKILKLTNIELEQLNNSSDMLIKIFCRQIIFALNDESLLPSWIKQECLENYYIDLINNENIKIKQEKNSYIDLKNNIESKINNFNEYINILTVKTEKLRKKIKKYNKSLYRQKNLIKNILSFGIYAILTTNKRKSRLKTKINKLTDNLNNLIKELKDTELAVEKSKIEIIDEQRILDLKIENIQNEIKRLQLECDYEASQIERLPTTIENKNDFIPLKTIAGLKNEHITGCYIIRNNENDKYYVGQSKDVFKRLKQHFNGTTPKNIIFAEDYYNSQFKNKEDLFSVKILKLITKDQLDSTEKQLIADYDSFNNGYNGTGGNA